MASIGRRGIRRDALLRRAGQAGQRRVGERHLAALAAAGRLPFLGDRARERFGVDAQHRATRQVHRPAVQQDRVAGIDGFDRRGIPEALHAAPAVSTEQLLQHAADIRRLRLLLRRLAAGAGRRPDVTAAAPGWPRATARPPRSRASRRTAEQFLPAKRAGDHSQRRRAAQHGSRHGSRILR